MDRAKRRSFVAAIGLVTLSAVLANEAALPPLECVRLLRQARIAGMNGDPERQVTLLRQAAESFPDELIPVVALLDHHRKFDASPTEVAELRSLLTRRLADPERPVPQGTLEYLVMAPDAEPEDLALVQNAVSSRLAAAADDLSLLAAQTVLQVRLQRFDDLHDTLQRRLALRPTPDLHWQCMVLDSESERWSEVAQHARKLVDYDPDSPFLRMMLVESLAKAGEYDELIQQLELVEAQLERLPRAAANRGLQDLLLSVAWELRDAEQDQRAEAMFRRLVAIDPSHNAARQALLYFYSTDEERRAHEAALARTRSEESDPHVLLDEGAGLLAGGDAAGALDLLRRAAKALPDSEIAHFNLGLAALRLERWAEAEQALRRAVELNPARAEAHLNHGVVLHQLQRCEAAIAPLLRALQLQPDLTQAHYYLYQCYKSLGNRERTETHLKLYRESVAE